MQATVAYRIPPMEDLQTITSEALLNHTTQLNETAIHVQKITSTIQESLHLIVTSQSTFIIGTTLNIQEPFYWTYPPHYLLIKLKPI